MSKDINLVTEDRKQRRINMENEYLNQIDLEEAAVDDFFPVLTRVEEIQPDVMTTDSQISSTVDPIEFMDEEALMKLKLKHMRAEQCRTRTHKMLKLFIESATDVKKKENLEHMLLATINNLDRKMSKFKEGLDDYDQKEQYVLMQTERLQNEQEKALQEQRELQEVLQGLQAKHKVAEDELKALQKEKEDADEKKKEMEDKINKERKAKIWREQRLEEERQKLKDLERKRKEKGSLKGEEEENKKIREQQDRLLAERLMEKERREREMKDRNLAEQLQKKQRLEKDEREKFLAEQLLEKERQEEEEMIRNKEEQEQLDREEQIRLEEERQFNLTEEQKRLQKKELERLRKEHLKTLEREKREKEKKLKGMVDMLPALPPMNYDNLNRRIGELDDYPLEIPVAIIAIVLVVSTVFLVATLVVYAYIIFRLRKNIKILFPMAKLLTGQATGSEAQEIKRMLLTLLEIPAGQHCPPPLPLRPTRLAITPAETTSAQTISSTGAAVVVKDKIELLTTPKQIKRYGKYLVKQKEKLQEDTKL